MTTGGSSEATTDSTAEPPCVRRDDHDRRDVEAFAVNASTVTVPNDAGSWYCLVVAAGPAAVTETSYGRNSFGAGRPSSGPRRP